MTSTPPNTTPQTQPDDGIKEMFRTIFYAMLIALVIRTFAFEPFNIPSSSMEPSLLVGDFLFVSKYSYGYGSTGTFWGLAPFHGRIGGSDEPKRGDVVVFKGMRDSSIDYIKRLIGLPGDTLQMRHGMLYINGVPVERDRLAEPVRVDDLIPPPNATDYLEHLPNGPAHIIRKLGDDMPLDNTDVYVVPPHHYFFMGDNRDNSQDSRTQYMGYIDESNLVGKAEFLFFSLDADTHFWQFWRWPWTIRWNRIFMKIR
jgi:signal peptidase I